jgi:tetratricopeptide (TPR) repeat protein
LPLADFELSFATEAEGEEPRGAFDPPVIPPSWQRVEPAGRSLIGIDLFGLRTVPFVDREPVRDNLWHALRETERQQAPRGVVLTGSAGSGKSRLVRWITQRANETGGVRVLSAFHGPAANPMALTNMLLDACSGHGLAPEPLGERIGALLPNADASLIQTVVGFLAEPQKRMATTATARNVMLTKVFEAVSDRRPIILWLDDVVWGHDAMGLAEHLLNEAPAVAVLVVMTVRSEALDGDPVMAERLARMTRVDHVDELQLEPLEKRHQRELVQRMLGLTASLTDDVVARTGGNPLFAVQLVGDLVQRDQLRDGIEGVELRDEGVKLPADMQDLWSRRVHELVESFPPDWDILQVLVIAAALGDRVEHDEFDAIVEMVGLRDPIGVVDAMVRRRLAFRMETGWRFAHGLLREAIESMGRTDGRWIAANAACVNWLKDHLAGGFLDHWSRARLGRYWVQANRIAEGFDCIFDASMEAIHAEEMLVAGRLIDEAEQLVEELDLAPGDERLGHLTVRRYLAERYMKPLEETLERARSLVIEASQKGWKAVEAEARMLMGTRLSGMSKFEDALEHQRAARVLLEELGEHERSLHAKGMMAYTMWFTDRRDEALALQHEVAKQREAIGNASDMASDMEKLGFMYLERDPRKSMYYYRKAAELADRLGRRELQAHIIDGMGGVAVQLGNYEDAIDHYREAARLFDLVGSPAASMARYHDAHVRMIYRGEWAGPLSTLDRVIPVFETFGVAMYVASASAGKALAHDQMGEWTASQAALEKMQKFWGDQPNTIRGTQFADFLGRLRASANTATVEVVEAFVSRHGIEVG